jgi:uncharacterized membrane protein
MKSTEKMLLGAAVAGLLGSAAFAAPGKAAGKKVELAPCYGINSCKGHGQCGGKGSSCAGANSCKGAGWLKVPKDVCEKINGGSLAPIEAVPETKN